MPTSRFVTRQPSFWSQLDVVVHEGDAEAKQFDERVRTEIKWKSDGLEAGASGIASGNGLHHPDIRYMAVRCPDEAPDRTNKLAQANKGSLVRRKEVKERNTGNEGTNEGRNTVSAFFRPADEVRASGSDCPLTTHDDPVIYDEPGPLPLEAPSHRSFIPLSRPHLARLKPATAISTPTQSRLTGSTTLPSVPTPQDTTTPLLAPIKRSSTSRLRQISAQTPDAIASPIDTPNVASSAAARVAAKDSTPVPLGSGSIGGGKMKKEYLALTEHYASFAKKMSKEAEKEEAAARAREHVKAGSRSLRSATRAPPLRLGGKVFDGLRFCIPLEIGPPAKQKNKWEIVCAHLQMSRTLKADTQAGRRSHHQTRYGHDARHMGQDVRVHAGTATGLVHA